MRETVDAAQHPDLSLSGHLGGDKDEGAAAFPGNLWECTGPTKQRLGWASVPTHALYSKFKRDARKFPVASKLRTATFTKIANNRPQFGWANAKLNTNASEPLNFATKALGTYLQNARGQTDCQIARASCRIEFRKLPGGTSSPMTRAAQNKTLSSPSNFGRVVPSSVLVVRMRQSR